MPVTKALEYRDVVDKTGWGHGPWQDEATGLPCLIVRGPVGALCGYVGVLEGHALHGISYGACYFGAACSQAGSANAPFCNHRPESLLAAHGGITYAAADPILSPREWKKWRAIGRGWQRDAKQYPSGDAAKNLVEWASTFTNYYEWVKQSHARLICRIPSLDLPEKIWWFGFDCAHAGDATPGINALVGARFGNDEYRDLAYVAAQCKGLAKQLKEKAHMSNEIVAPLVGAHYRPPAKAILQVLPAGCELTLTPEPDNPFDNNAVMVSVSVKATVAPEQHETLKALAAGYGFDLHELLARDVWHLGYIARVQAKALQEGPGALKAPHAARLSFDMAGKPQVSLELKS